MSAFSVLLEVYSAWSDGDLPSLMDWVADDIVFAVNVPPGVKSHVGKGVGKRDFEAGLRRLLAECEVIDYTPQWTKQVGLWHRVHVAYAYRERRTGLTIEGTMRHRWRVVGDEVVQLEVHLDSPRMDAFRRLAQAECRV
jgi:ketosteroid isomerase-like protein